MHPEPTPSPTPHPTRRRGRAPLLGALAALGLALVAIPWVMPGQPMRLPPLIVQGSSGYQELVAVAHRVDTTCARGDVEGLRDRVTAGQWQSIAASLKAAGRGLDSSALQEQGYLVGDLEDLPFLHGASSGSAAVLVFYRSRPGLGAGAGLGSLLALVFVWDGASFLLHQKRSEAMGPQDDRTARASAWADELLP